MDRPPAFSAVSTSVRQLHQLLRCIAFAPKAEVQITATGIKFSVDEARVVQGLTFVEKSLFSTYTFTAEEQLPPFEVNLSALLETLQIFGVSEAGSSHKNAGGGFSSSYTNAFTAPSLALGGTCRISYQEAGAPLSITIQEGAVTTTCEINTYETRGEYDDEGIPLDRNSLCLKIIMRSAWLHDAINELSATNPEVLQINASERSQPYLALEGQGGPFGDATIDYSPESKGEPNTSANRTKKQPLVAETFVVAAPGGTHGRIKQKYKFDLIRKAVRAMGLASKVSIRQDEQGVLSLQFLVEVETGAGSKGNDVSNGVARGTNSKVSFVDFRFVPLAVGDSSEDGDDSGKED